MRGFRFSDYKPGDTPKGGFDELLKLFSELLNYTAGDAAEALSWLNELDKQYKLTNNDYGIGNFIDDLKDKGYLTEDNQSGESYYDKTDVKWKNFIKANYNNPYLKELRFNYNKTPFYAVAAGECSYLGDFIRPKTQ